MTRGHPWNRWPFGPTTPIPLQLAEAIAANRRAPMGRSVSRLDLWRIRKLDGRWFAWPIEPGVYVDLFGRVDWLHEDAFLPLLADVRRRIYSR